MPHGLYRHLAGAGDLDEVLSDTATVRAMLHVEAALAEALADAGRIPVELAAYVRAAVHDDYDLEALARAAARSGNLAIPLVAALTGRVRARSAAAAGIVHLGATSQDVVDTALVLQMRDAAAVIDGHLARANAAMAAHARAYATQVMAGRTWLQHATPITFGLKCAGWLDGTLRARARLRDAVADASVLQFGGASGTLAALGADGEAVTTALAARLGLRTPDMPWHVERDRLAQVGAALGIACGTLGKIARDLSLLAQTEVGEARDRDEEGVGGSSTMPHKRNPVRAAVALTAATRAPGLVATLLAAMVQEHERGLGGWQAEWTTLPELLGLTSGAARTMAELLEHLVVDAHAMRARLIESDGYMLAESVATALAPSVGRDEAHRLVEEVCRAAIDGRQPLAYALLHDARVTHALPPQAIAQALDPAAYLGTTATFIRNVLARYDASVTLA